ISTGAADEVRLKLRRLGFQDSAEIVLLHPFAHWEFRAWRVERFVELSKRLASAGARVVLMGMANEIKKSGMTSNALPDGVSVYVLDGAFEMPALFKRVSLFIGNDSGPLHLAASMRIPTVGLFGPAPPELTGPEGSANCYRRLECSPCNQLKCVRPENPCMDFINVDEVVEAVAKARGGVHQHGIARQA
ncbi:MAG TPA: glycosyltransferase family 9 protein, partial [Bacteroidota bacterium]|nr:glycosyltransferase family 9 protein [Bacteroidota bacterium]